MLENSNVAVVDCKDRKSTFDKLWAFLFGISTILSTVLRTRSREMTHVA